MGQSRQTSCLQGAYSTEVGDSNPPNPENLPVCDKITDENLGKGVYIHDGP